VVYDEAMDVSGFVDETMKALANALGGTKGTLSLDTAKGEARYNVVRQIVEARINIAYHTGIVDALDGQG
jgi:hypothetical protein